MHEVLAALIGAATGFFLPSLAAYIRSRTKGTRFENAANEDLDAARESIHQKMMWLSRDQTPFRAQTEERLLVEFEGKLLYLGEDEEFIVALPFWEQNLRDIAEVASTRAFNKIARKVLLTRKFVSKFREMKLAFKIGGGDPKQMALACYRELEEIHKQLLRD